MTIKRMSLAFMHSTVHQVNSIVWIRQNLHSNKIRLIHHYPATRVRQVHIHRQCILPTSHDPIVTFSHIHRSSPNHSKIPPIFIFRMSTHHRQSVIITVISLRFIKISLIKFIAFANRFAHRTGHITRSFTSAFTTL